MTSEHIKIAFRWTTAALMLALVPLALAQVRTRSTLDDIVLSEDFESVASGTLPSGWQQLDFDGGYSSWFQRTSTWQTYWRGGFSAHSGERFAMCPYNDNSLPNDDWLILPQLTHLAEPVTLTYWVASQDSTYPESYEVLVSSRGTQPGDFDHVLFSDSATPAIWTQQTLDLSPFVGGPFWVAFHCNSVNRFCLKLDDIRIEAQAAVSGTVIGLVVDDSLRPVVDATVVIADQSGRTDSTGHFLISEVPPGIYTVNFSHPFYFPSELIDVEVPGDTMHADVHMTPRALIFKTYASGAAPRPILDFDTLHFPIWGFVDTLLVYDVDVTVTLNHPYIGDLDLWLVSASGRRVQLVSHDPLDAGVNLRNCRFDDNALRPYTAGHAPYTGVWRPYRPLSRFLGDSLWVIRGSYDPNWWLYVYDNSAGDEGSVTSVVVNIAAPRMGAVRGVVSDALSGSPLSGVAISVRTPLPFTTTVTDTLGRFVLPAPVGPCTIGCVRSGYEVYLDSTLIVTEHDTVALEVAMSPASKAGEVVTLPNELRLDANYPNPFNAATVFRFTLPRNELARLTIYDLLGRERAQLVNAILNAGDHEIRFDASALSSGVYFARLSAGERSITQKIVLLK